MKQPIIAYLIICSCLALMPLTVYGYGTNFCCMGIETDKTEYLPGERVLISIVGALDYANSTEKVSINITDVTFGPNFSKVVYHSEKKLVKGRADFEFKTPAQDTDRYRYMVTAMGPTNADPIMFFTKKDASKVVMSDARILTPAVLQGENLRFETKVVDGIGNPFHYALINADSRELPQVQDCRGFLVYLGQ